MNRFVIEAIDDRTECYVVDVSASSTVIDLSAPAAAGLRAVIQRNQCLMLDCGPEPVYYRGSTQGTAVVDASATMTNNPSRQGGVIHAGRFPAVYHFQSDVNAIAVATATGSSRLRFSRL